MTVQTDHERPDTPLKDFSRRRLVNILNWVNYKGGEITTNVKNRKDGNGLTLRATPEPCGDDTVRLVWSETPPSDMGISSYELVSFFVDKGAQVIVVGGEVTAMNCSEMEVILPARCYATSKRHAERFTSSNVRAMLSDGPLKATGRLRDFGGGCLRIRVPARAASSFNEEGDEQFVHVVLTTGKTVVYRGKGVIRRRITDGANVDMVIALTASTEEKSRGEVEEVDLSRPLVAYCRHPLSGRIVRLSILKSSYNSFVLSELPEHAALFSGLIIPSLKIDFGAGDYAECTAQVMGGEDGTWFVTVLDMPLLDQRKIFSFIEKETHMSAGISNVIDPDDLIEFFFEVGFIYPKKYASLSQSRGDLRQILSRLYIDTPTVAQHFVRYNKDAIEAHIAMVRFYERSWVVHHHSAIGGLGAGSTVLSQIFRYIHHYSALPSTGMDYVMTYYRPENRFPDRVLGGLARFLNNPSLCSIDTYAYLHLCFEGCDAQQPIDMEWQLEPAKHEDLLELEDFYGRASGGLSVKAFGLQTTVQNEQKIDLDAEFQKAGLRRQKRLYSLKKHGKLKAVIMAVDSDDGLNMSNLMKCIHLFVVDSEDLPFDQLMAQLKRLSALYDKTEVPVLVFPSSYVSNEGVTPEKVYNLLIFHVSVGKRFNDFVKRMTDRTARRNSGGTDLDQRGEASEPQ